MACYGTLRRAALLTHIILPIYLATDLVINIAKFSSPISDFRFLIAVPGGGIIATLVCLFIVTFAITIVLKTMEVIQVHKDMYLIWGKRYGIK